MRTFRFCLPVLDLAGCIVRMHASRWSRPAHFKYWLLLAHELPDCQVHMDYGTVKPDGTYCLQRVFYADALRLLVVVFLTAELACFLAKCDICVAHCLITACIISDTRCLLMSA
eukprot:TRINITY_DN23846_c0_g1_i4.p2 TRINITY_DN23846_c0_g1~~TRINITY_DN23846_c0_g1_i4.p2  ORF type:complete len:114 (-),score=9.96 TRINITY_DN23846_c0_g1_i4:202-543(-)